MKLSHLNYLPRTIALAALTLSATAALHAAPVAPSANGTPNQVQATDDPYNLPSSGPVMAGGSTAASAAFDNTLLPEAEAYIAQNLPEAHDNLGSSAFQVNPDKIVLATSQAVTATFIHDGGAFDSAVGVDAIAPGGSDPGSSWDEVTSPTAKLVFANTGSTVSQWPSGPVGTRVSSQPVLPGDFVNMGTYAAGTKLDFFLMANGANQSWANIFSADESLNADGFSQHVAAFTPTLFAVPQLNSPYLFLAFKDMWGGGDKDINDAIIAINVGSATVKALLATPEPAMPLTFTACLGLALFAVRKNQKNHQKKVTSL